MKHALIIFSLVILPIYLLQISCHDTKPTLSKISELVYCSDYVHESGVGGQVQFNDENLKVVIDHSVRNGITVTRLIAKRAFKDNRSLILEINEEGKVEMKEINQDTEKK